MNWCSSSPLQFDSPAPYLSTGVDSVHIVHLSLVNLLKVYSSKINVIRDFTSFNVVKLDNRKISRKCNFCFELHLKRWQASLCKPRSEERRVGKECRSRWS